MEPLQPINSIQNDQAMRRQWNDSKTRENLIYLFFISALISTTFDEKTLLYRSFKILAVSSFWVAIFYSKIMKHIRRFQEARQE